MDIFDDFKNVYKDLGNNTTMPIDKINLKKLDFRGYTPNKYLR